MRVLRYNNIVFFKCKKDYLFDRQIKHSIHIETVVLLSHTKIDRDNSIIITLENFDAPQKIPSVTYKQIKEYVKENYDLNVTSLNIAKIKQKYNLTERECYNHPKSENSRQPNCPPEKEDAIVEAFRHYGLIE